MDPKNNSILPQDFQQQNQKRSPGSWEGLFIKMLHSVGVHVYVLCMVLMFMVDEGGYSFYTSQNLQICGQRMACLNCSFTHHRGALAVAQPRKPAVSAPRDGTPG